MPGAEGRNLKLLSGLPECRTVPVAEHPHKQARDWPRRHALDCRDELLAMLGDPGPGRQHAMAVEHRALTRISSSSSVPASARGPFSNTTPVIRSGPWILPSFSPE